MITSNSTEPRNSSPSSAPSNAPSDAQTQNDGDAVPVMNPRGPIEVVSDGGGTVNDPSGRDIKPPFTGGFEAPV
jgi:hypothetical protein